MIKTGNKPIGSTPEFTDQQEIQYLQLYQRLGRICKAASENSVRVLIDAEESCFQPAIDEIANRLSEIYNKEQPIIHNTYQMYLTEGQSKLQR
jgi:proline dehydrogenase